MKPFNVELSDNAVDDFDKSYKFYYEDSPEVAETFLKQIDFAFENIKQSPESFPVVYKDIRNIRCKEVSVCDLL